jgi:UDP-N-acetyl-D-galactosamine dehydrogenase
MNPGDREHTVDRITKVVAGQTPEVAALLEDLYGSVTEAGVFVARDIRTAEAAKVIENAQRDINIAFINEVTQIFHRSGISIYDVLDAASTKWNFLAFSPGLVGGHCIGVDPYYLAHWAQETGHPPHIILAGRRINDGMGAYIAACIENALVDLAIKNGGADVLVLGLTFKEDVPDLRNSKVVDMIAWLADRGHRVEVHDPLANPEETRALYGLDLLAEFDGGAGPYDCVIGAVSHRAYRGLKPETFQALLRPRGLVADIKGMWRSVPLPEGLRRWQL